MAARAELIATAMKSGRVLPAGDSAHTMSPTGGMGMNTGMGDAADLGWKLEAVLQGWGGGELLESYGIERRPIAIRNAAASTHNFKAWQPGANCTHILDDDEKGRQLRAQVGQELRRTTRTDWESWGLQVGYRYEGSPICVPDGTPAMPDDYSTYVPTARPGSRAPHAWLDHRCSTLDLFGKGFVLLCFPDANESLIADFVNAAAGMKMPLTPVHIANPEIAKLYAMRLVLVRQDGHVAWRGNSTSSAKAILDVVRGVRSARRRARQDEGAR